MSDQPEKASVRIRLNERLHYDMGLRAKEVSLTRDQYAGLLLRYALIETTVLSEAKNPEAVAAKGGQELFVSTTITPAFRERLEKLSEEAAVNIASFCGRLVEAYIGRFERDPRDFRMLPALDLAMEGTDIAEESLVKDLVRQCAEDNPGVKSGYLATWTFSRLRLRVQSIRIGDKDKPLTPALITDWLK